MVRRCSSGTMVYAGPATRSSSSARDFSRGPTDRASKLRAVVGEDHKRVSCAANRHIELLAVDQFGRESRVDIDDDSVNRRALGGVRGGSVTVVYVSQATARSVQLSATIEPHHRTAQIDGFDRGELAVGDAKRSFRCAELYAVAS